MKPTISIKKIKLKQKMGYELCRKELYHTHGLIPHSEHLKYDLSAVH